MRCYFLNGLAIVLCLFSLSTTGAQQTFVSEPIWQHLAALTKNPPPDIETAYGQQGYFLRSLDTLEQMFTASYPSLADKLNRRSAKLNSFAGYNEQGATLTMVQPNPEMTAFFRGQWEKMDELEGAINKSVISFYGKDLYQSKGYIPVWDSVYKRRLPALARYRDGILQLVSAELAYLKANAKMLASKEEDERMQYVETELAVLQKLVMLKSKFRKVVVEDGAEKLAYCVQHPNAYPGSKNL